MKALFENGEKSVAIGRFGNEIVIQSYDEDGKESIVYLSAEEAAKLKSWIDVLIKEIEDEKLENIPFWKRLL